MITFNPGPSQISDNVKEYILDFIKYDIGSLSHRSTQFTDISLWAREGLRKFLGVPENYKIFYLSSATEGMEVMLKSFVVEHSHHYINGSFSKKCYKVAKEIGKKPTKEEVPLWKGNFSLEVPEGTELICVTHNETSTGVQVLPDFIPNLRRRYPTTLIGVDITSSGGWIIHDITQADIWFFSVQKCFGLPAGLGIIMVNEKALEKSKIVVEQTWTIGSTHSLPNMLDKYEKAQTDETPNVFLIYLLSRQLEYLNNLGMQKIEEDTLKKYQFIQQKVLSIPWLSLFVEDDEYASRTVFVISCSAELQEKMKQALKAESIFLGSGYGELKDTTFRISNFPSISLGDLEKTFSIIEKLLA